MPPRGPPPQGARSGYVPGDDYVSYGDGGAFPEIDVEQYPLAIGRVGNLVRTYPNPLSARSGRRRFGCSRRRSTARFAPFERFYDPSCVHQVPLTLLSGFLGAGKTTTLKHVLENQEGKRVAVVVNDIAEVNIDFKLLRRKPVGEFDGDLDLSDTMELENGCADSRPLTGPVGRN